jgi:aquaporin Z
MAAQAIAGVIAAVMVVTVKPAAQMPVVTLQVVPALLAEFLFTFALAFVVLNVATAAKSQGNFYFGLAIGFTVMAGAYSVGNISGGAFNPAVALGITVMGISSVSQIWIFLLANFAGGACAALAFKAVNPDEV